MYISACSYPVVSNGIARMLKRLRKSKGDYWIMKKFSSITSLFKGSEFFPLRAVPYGMENYFYNIRWPPLNVTIFITHVCNSVMGAAPMGLCMQFTSSKNVIYSCLCNVCLFDLILYVQSTIFQLNR